ncbi:MAG: excisionase [Oscillospiraceae bacterium]|nr:excisionase [Oscillospiraceae bacterium]
MVSWVRIPYWEKYMLTLREAAEYFHIGEKKMRQIVDENMDANFLLTSGNRVMIKRKLFEEYLNAASVI